MRRVVTSRHVFGASFLSTSHVATSCPPVRAPGRNSIDEGMKEGRGWIDLVRINSTVYIYAYMHIHLYILYKLYQTSYITQLFLPLTLGWSNFFFAFRGRQSFSWRLSLLPDLLETSWVNCHQFLTASILRSAKWLKTLAACLEMKRSV